jgi:nucleotide-binding universal stress UspA family protein
MFERGLICTDFTDGLQRLVKFVDSLAKSGLKEITFFHNIVLWKDGEVPRIDTDKIEEIKAIFTADLGDKPPNVQVNLEISSGNVVNNILQAIDKYQIDVIIKGLPYRKSWEEKIFGSTTLELTKKLTIPMMVFRPQLISVYREEEMALRCQHLNRFWLIPYNDGEAARYLIDRVKYYASKKSADVQQKCLLLTVVEDTGRSQIIMESHFQEAQNKLAKLKPELENLGLNVETLVTKGNPFLETIKVAFEYDISAIAISDDQDHGILDWTVPSYAQEILHRSWFPLLYFPLSR